MWTTTGLTKSAAGAVVREAVSRQRKLSQRQPPIALTRSRAYQSNDQAWVGQPRESRESITRNSLRTPDIQKNGMLLVSRVVG